MGNPTGVSLDVKLGVSEGSSLVLLHAPPKFGWAPPRACDSHAALGVTTTS
jgi:hypothetical protein